MKGRVRIRKILEYVKQFLGETKRREESEKRKRKNLAINQSKVRVGLTFYNLTYIIL